MATKVIDHNEARVPFFGDKLSFVTGLDPLGLQNPSTQVYTFLLPGLNNVTSRIRNYSFYCWLLDEYAKQIKDSNPDNQKLYIRRAEYIIALLSIEGDIPGISGSTYATNRFNEGIQTFDLHSGTYNEDKSTIGTYWQYHFGIFGQYYLASLRQIGLIEEPVNDLNVPLGIYRRTSHREHLKVSGEELANAFDENISVSNKELFFFSIRSGSIDRDTLKKLMVEFNPKQIASGSKEEELLIQLLIDNDEPTKVHDHSNTMRKDTLVHLLQLSKKNGGSIDDRMFTMNAYNINGKLKGVWDESLTGWYYYQFNEYWQVACTSILNGLLDYLEELRGPNWMAITDLISESTMSILSYLKGTGLISKNISTISAITEAIQESEKSLYVLIDKENKVPRMAYGFLLIWKMHSANSKFIDYLQDYVAPKNIGNYDDVLSFYKKYERYNMQSIDQFISDFLLHRIICRHQYVAYRKMGGGSQSTQKFIVEENLIRKIGNFGPGFTGPRVGNLLVFLEELHLLDGERRLTIKGEKLLESNML